MKKNLFVLSTIALTCNLLPFTGVKFTNNLDVPVEGKIENFTYIEWVKVEPKKSENIPSKSGDRKIFWREYEKEKYKKNPTYSTKESYSMPHEIIIHTKKDKTGKAELDSNKKSIIVYDMISGISKTKKSNLTPHVITHKSMTKEELNKKLKDLKEKEKKIKQEKLNTEKKLTENRAQTVAVQNEIARLKKDSEVDEQELQAKGQELFNEATNVAIKNNKETKIDKKTRENIKEKKHYKEKIAEDEKKEAILKKEQEKISKELTEADKKIKEFEDQIKKLDDQMKELAN